MPYKVHKLEKSEIDRAVETIFAAFINDPVMLWLFGGVDGYHQHARFAIKTWVRWSMLYGLAIATDNCEAVALRRKPGKQEFTFWGMLRTGMFLYPRVLGKKIFGRIIELGKIIEAEQARNMGKQKFWYCWVLAVKPDKQGQGYGKALMQYTFDLARCDNLPCYLETATPVNLQIHGHNGFELVSQQQITDSDVMLYSMLRKVR